MKALNASARVCGRAFLEDHEPATPLGTGFRNATEVKMNGSDCVIGLQRDHRRARAASTRRSAPLSNCASIRRSRRMRLEALLLQACPGLANGLVDPPRPIKT